MKYAAHSGSESPQSPCHCLRSKLDQLTAKWECLCFNSKTVQRSHFTDSTDLRQMIWFSNYSEFQIRFSKIWKLLKNNPRSKSDELTSSDKRSSKLELFIESLSNRLRSFAIVWDRLKSFETIWNHLQSPEIACNRLRSLKNLKIARDWKAEILLRN